MSNPLEDRVVEEWLVVWFPPDKERDQRNFTTAEQAQKYAAKQDWNPLIVHRTTTIVNRIVPLREA